MAPADRREATTVLQAVLAALLTSGGGRAGATGADLRRSVGALTTGAVERIEAGDFGTPLRACFRAAADAGATFAGMTSVWQVASGFSSESPVVRRVAQTSIRFALVEMCLILSRTTFRSRQDAEAALARINEVFEPAETFAADQRNATVYRALVALHAATVRDLTQRVRQLPRLVAYSFPRRTPALALANRLYGDGGRYLELIAENRVVHPLFAPSAGRALAV